MISVWLLLHPEITAEMLGDIPLWLSSDDPRPAKEQIDTAYRHGGGWDPFPGFRLLDDNSLKYPGDPPTMPLAQTKLRDELIVFYDFSWLAIIQPDRSFEVCRVD